MWIWGKERVCCEKKYEYTAKKSNRQRWMVVHAVGGQYAGRKTGMGKDTLSDVWRIVLETTNGRRSN